MIRKLFAEGGQTDRIEPPFFCDNGFNIRLGESVYFNYNSHELDARCGSTAPPAVCNREPIDVC